MRVRHLLAALAVLLLAAPLLTGAAGAAAAYPPGGLRVVAGVVNPATVHAGGSVTFVGDGFAPAAALQLSVDGTDLQQLRADSRGAFSLAVPLRDLGRKALAVSGLETGSRLRIVTAQVVVTPAAAVSALHAGWAHTLPSLLLGFALVALGAGVVLASRARGHRRTLAGHAHA